MIKAVFFDFDGTIYSHRSNAIPASAIEALTQLKDHSILSFLCTGRSFPELQQFDISGIRFDGMILSNGQLALDGDGRIIYEKPISGILKQELLRMFEERKLPVYIATKDDLILNYVDDFIVSVQGSINSEMPEVKPYQGEEFYAGCIFMDNEEAHAEVNELKRYAEVTYWHEGAVDVVPYGVSKASGIDRLLKMYDISPEETMGIGDGDNDIEMFRHCGIAIAMGNSSDFVKEAAGYVTEDIDENGLYNALKRFELI